MIDVQDARKGTIIELDGDLYEVLEYSHHKMARGNAVIRLKLRNLSTGSTVERTFTGNQRVQDVRLDHAQVQYLYQDGDLYYFMDTETYEQFPLSKEVLGDAVNYLTDGLVLKIETYKGKPVRLELPTTVDLKVVDAEPGFAGDTAGSASKWCTVETGLKVRVPLFIEAGDTIRVDTRTGEYVTRVE